MPTNLSKASHLSNERQAQIIKAVVDFYKSEFDEDLSEFRAATLVEFMLLQIGPSQYNQAIQDARKFMAQKLDDLDTEFYQPEER